MLARFSPIRSTVAGLALTLVVCVCACTPALDWREVRPEGSDAVAWFPCKPASEVRSVMLGNVQSRMTLVACQAADATYSLAFITAADPSQVGNTAQAWRTATAANLAASAQTRGAFRVTGMTPSPHAERIWVTGALPGGEAVMLEAGFFVKGTRVFRATVSGRQLSSEAVQEFFGGVGLAG